MQTNLELTYPLHLKRFLNQERIAIVDSAGIPVAQAVNYDHAYEIVRLANCAYKLLSDIQQKKPYENSASTPRNLGRAETEPGIPDPAGTDRP